MTLTVTQAIARVRRYLDDYNAAADARWTDAQIEDSIKVAGQQIMTEAAGLGLDMFKLTSTTSSSGGVATLSPAINKIFDVSCISGAARLRVMPGQPKSTVFVSNGLDGRQLEVTYIPAYVHPATVSDPITFSTGLTFSNDAVDSYLCLLAARDCKVVEGDVNQQLENQLMQLKTNFRSLSNNPSWSVQHTYGKQYRTGYSYYQLSPTTIKVAI